MRLARAALTPGSFRTAISAACRTASKALASGGAMPIDGGQVECKARRHAVEGGKQGLAVGFAGRQKPQHEAPIVYEEPPRP